MELILTTAWSDLRWLLCQHAYHPIGLVHLYDPATELIFLSLMMESHPCDEATPRCSK